MTDTTARIGVVGTGFIARGLVMTLDGRPDVTVSKVLTRTDPGKRQSFPGKESSRAQ